MRYWVGSLIILLLVSFGALPDAHAQQRTIQGQVQDSATATPVTGVTVLVQDTDIGAFTDQEGRFDLTGVPAGSVTLVVSGLGWQTRSFPVAPGVESVTILLERDILRLEELVVSGRATAVRRRNLAHSVAILNAEEVTETPQATLGNALQGKLPGALISQNEGTPGGGLQLRLRGSTTINALSTPLYVVDGVLISNFSIGDNRGVLVGGGQGEGEVPRVADINPLEIESIEVLKGPSAAAIYGSKAANGVVIITTKRGTAGAPRVSLRARGGFFDLQNVIPTRTFRTVEEAVDAFGPIAEEEPFATNIQQGRRFDNQERIAGRNALSWELSGSVSGGSGVTSYHVSASAKDDEGIIENTGFERQSVRVNLASEVGPRFDYNVNLNLLHTQQGRGLTNNDNNQTSFWMTFPATPNFIDLGRQPDGTFAVNPFVGNGSNPLQTAALLENTEEVYRFIASGGGDFALLEGARNDVILRANLGVDFFTQRNSLFSPPSIFFEPVDGRPGSALLTNTENLNLNAELSGVWDLQADAWTLTSSTGLQFERRAPTFVRLVSRDLVAGKPIVDAGTVEAVTERREQVEDFGFFVQEELLALDERLLLTAALRLDQSSANSDEKQLFIYPKASGSYRFPDLGGILDEVKVRAAFGQTGNQPLFGQKFTNLDITGKLEGINFLRLEGSFAGELEPERQTEVEGGIDIAAFDGRARLEATAYVQFIENLILQRDLPPSTGFNVEFFNGGEMRNQGLELVLDATPVLGEGLEWRTRTSFFLNRNKVTELPVPPFFDGNFAVSLGAFQVKEGQSLTTIVGTAGTDADGNTLVEAFGNADPTFTFNVSNSLAWNGFRLYGLAQWRYGQDVINLTELLFDLAANSEDFVDPDGTVRSVDECFPDCSGEERIAGFFGGSARAYVQSASFFKLRELSLSWQLPADVRARLFGGAFQSVRLSATASNLVKITPYRGMDPEVSQFGITPFRGVDIAPFPPSRSFFFGVDVTL